jgi:hypothetical protein
MPSLYRTGLSNGCESEAMGGAFAVENWQSMARTGRYYRRIQAYFLSHDPPPFVCGYTHQGSIYSFTMKKQKTASLRRTKLINPKELDPLVLPVRKALDAISDGSGLSPEETISISLFATIAEQVAILRHKEKGEVAAQRLATAIEQMIQEGAIDEEVLDQMKADFFNLTLMIRSVPAIDVWQIVDNVTRK